MMDGEVVGTKNPTGHSLLLDCRFELPFGKISSLSDAVVEENDKCVTRIFLVTKTMSYFYKQLFVSHNTLKFILPSLTLAYIFYIIRKYECLLLSLNQLFLQNIEAYEVEKHNVDRFTSNTNAKIL